MTVKADIEAIEADPTLTPEQKYQRTLQVKADNLGAEMSRRVGPSFTLNGIRWTVHEASVVQQGNPPLPLVRAVLSAKVAPNGAQLLTATDPRNPFFWFNPPVLIADGGTEPNPDYDANDPASHPTRPTYVEDAAAIGSAMLSQIDLGV